MGKRAALVPVLDRHLRARRLRRWRACGFGRFSRDHCPHGESQEARETYQFHRRWIICETRPANEKEIDRVPTARQVEPQSGQFSPGAWHKRLYNLIEQERHGAKLTRTI